MKPVVIPHKKVAGYLGLTDDKMRLVELPALVEQYKGAA